MKKIISILLITALVFSFSATAFAADVQNAKEETVYVMLDEGGDKKSVYVVNSYQNHAGELVDFGTYDSVRNLTTTDNIKNENGKVTGGIKDGKFYYEGKMSTAQIPWNIFVSYTLDGKEISAKELAGKSGKVEVSIGITQNKSANAIFFENYALQISTSFDTNKCGNIVADGATIANVGENKNISYSQLPKKEGTYKISLDAKGFEMGSVSINALPFSMNVSLDGMDSITDSFSPLTDGISQLNNGTNKLQSGSKDFESGLKQVADQSDTLAKTSTTIERSIAQLNALAASMGEAAPPQLKAGLAQLNEQYGAFNKGISSYTGGVKKTAEGYSAVNNGISELAKGTEELNNNTMGLEKQVQDKIDSSLSDFKGSEFTPMSFVSDKNTNVTAVQFVMKTDGISIPSKVVVVVEQPKKLSFWEKLLALFGF